MYWLIAPVFLAVVLLLNIEISLHLENAEALLTLTFLHFIKISRRLRVRREQGKIFTLYIVRNEGEKEVVTLRDIIRNSKKRDLTDSEKYARRRAMQYVIRHTNLDLSVYAAVGTGSAFSSAMLSGLLHITGGVFSAFPSKLRKNIRVQVYPLFKHKEVSIILDCIIKVSPANIIVGYIINKILRRRAARRTR